MTQKYFEKKKSFVSKGNIQARTLFNSIYLLSSYSKHFLGASRGFAFVTFASIENAKSWIEMKQVDNGICQILHTHVERSEIYLMKKIEEKLKYQ